MIPVRKTLLYAALTAALLLAGCGDALDGEPKDGNGLVWNAGSWNLQNWQ